MADLEGRTIIISGVSQEEVISGVTAHKPLRRTATDEEVAEVVVFVTSARAGGITGQTLLSTPEVRGPPPG
jgi:enoyl-[acyl-carrier-protein] reductase (NADH)